MKLRSLVLLGALGASTWLVADRWPEISGFGRARTHGHSGQVVPPRPGAADTGALDQPGPITVSGPPLPRAPAGQEMELALLSTPAAWYGASDQHAGLGGHDDEYREVAMAAAAGRKILYDPALARAARELAYQTAVLGYTPPEAVTTFLLHSAGAPDSTAAQFFVHTTAEGSQVLHELVRHALASDHGGMPGGAGPLRLGIGEVATPEQTYTRHLCVLVTRRAYTLEPALRHVELGGTWELRGRLPVDYRDAHVTVLYPDNRIGAGELTMRGSAFTASVPAGEVPGTMHVSIDGTGVRGPGKLLQLSVEIGRAPPARTRVLVPEADGPLATIEDAEQRAFTLLMADRARAGLPVLTPDPALAAIARAHSEDMRDNGFFGHKSPATGLLSERLITAGYRSTAHAENLAINDSLAEAQAALMASVGHRANIVATQHTHAGVGVAMRRSGGRIEWLVTQVFARPVVKLEPARARTQLLARIQDARAQAGAAAVRLAPRLSAVAEAHARAIADGGFDGAAARVLDDVRDVRASIRVSVSAIYDFDQLTPPEAVLDAQVAAVGLGIVQSPADPAGRTGVVFIAVEGTIEDID